ncbi:hypothetical protein BDQ17DRAFT_1233228 [Cyathus striatus]|nr:hypothetical protein BDQ17DRAFT_1233228 [Cyathus striatus]
MVVYTLNYVNYLAATAPAASSTTPVAKEKPLSSSQVITTTQVQAQPTTTTTEEKPSATAAPATTRAEMSSQAPGTTSSALPSFMVGTQTGQGTFYGTGLGAHGIVNTNTDFIAAAPKLPLNNFLGYTCVNLNNNPICNEKMKATYQGKSVTVTITDCCEACVLTDLEFFPSAF